MGREEDWLWAGDVENPAVISERTIVCFEVLPTPFESTACIDFRDIVSAGAPCSPSLTTKYAMNQQRPNSELPCHPCIPWADPIADLGMQCANCSSAAPKQAADTASSIALTADSQIRTAHGTVR